jgi:predicted RNase H-like HicB family nuclease
LPRQFDVLIERDTEGYYVASVPQIPGCHTQARSLDEVTQRIREAIELCLDGALHAIGIAEPLNCPELKGCQSQGSSLEEAIANIKEAIELYLETLPIEVT